MLRGEICGCTSAMDQIPIVKSDPLEVFFMKDEKMAPLLSLQNLCKYYTGSNVVVGLNHLNVNFRAGEFVAITGESGSGKSTLAHVISGMLPYEGGEMLLNGNPTSHFDSGDWERYRREQISFISQNYGILPGSTVLGNVVSALRITGMAKAEAEQKAKELLKLVELWHLRSRRAAKLSSGQKQRLSIARALAKPAPILIADEPTSNLDPENSAKVIELLAGAAKERLVILITHDFREAEGYVTRRISLQDGKILLDASLREAGAAVRPGAARPQKQKGLSAYVAGLQIGGRPVWSGLVVAFFALTAFAVFAFLGTFLVHLDDTSTRIYDNSAFSNGDTRRIVVQRPNREPFTQEDFDQLLALEYVECLERSGYVADVNYAYRQDVDYRVHYSVGGYVAKSSVELLEGMEFVRTVPVFADGREFLCAGRMPENMYEVVLAGSRERIGEKIPVYIRDVKTWNVSTYLYLEAEVVGVTDYGTGLYFDEELGRVFTNYMMGGGKFNETWLTVPLYRSFYLNNETAVFEDAAENRGEMQNLSEAECLMSAEAFSWYKQMNSRQNRIDQPVTLWIRNHNKAIRVTDENYGKANENPDYFQMLRVIGSHDSKHNNMLMVTPEVFDATAWAGNSDQVSLYITDYAYTQRVLDALAEMGYTALSPFRQCSTQKDPVLAAERIRTLTVCLGALAAVVVLMIFLLRELFGVQNESYRLLSDMGLGCGTARRSLMWQTVLFTVVGQSIGFSGIVLCGRLGLERIVHVMRYLHLGHWMILAAVHLLVALVSGLWIMNRMQRSVYPVTGEKLDLDLDEGAAV